MSLFCLAAAGCAGKQNGGNQGASTAGASVTAGEQTQEVSGAYGGDGDYSGYEYLGKVTYGQSEYSDVYVVPGLAYLEAQELEYWQGLNGRDMTCYGTAVNITDEDSSYGRFKTYDIYLRYYCIGDGGFPLTYATVRHCVVDDDLNAYCTGVEYVSGAQVATALQAKRLSVVGQREYTAAITDKAVLSTPQGASNAILHLSGGTVSEVIPAGFDGKILVYTFADGEHINYVLYDMGGYYLPYMIVSDEYAVTYREAATYLANATADSLRQVTKSFGNSKDMEDCREQAENFLILAADDAQDVALYGLYGCNGMVLRVGDAVCPLYKPWDSMGVDMGAGDYDGDGVYEYAFSLRTGYGTGYHREAVIVAKVLDGGIRYVSFDNLDGELGRISCEVVTGGNEINWYADGKLFGSSDYSAFVNDMYEGGKTSGNGEESGFDVDYGSILYFDVDDTGIMLRIEVGLVPDGNVTADYSVKTGILADVDYDGERLLLKNFRVFQEDLR